MSACPLINSKDWIEDCAKWHKRTLKGRYAHWCFDWDGLPVDETTPEEFDCCHCFDDSEPDCDSEDHEAVQ